MTLNPFDSDTALKRVDDCLYEGTIHRRWWVERGPHGGYLAALLMRALVETVGDNERAPRSLTVHFLAPPSEGSVTIKTAIERVGKSRSSMSARMEQDGRTVALALAAFSRSWEAVEYSEISMPEVAPPESIEPIREGSSLPPRFFGNFETRWALGSLPFSGATEALSGGWIGLAESRVLDAVAMTAISDAWVPSIFARMTEFAVVPTVDLSVHFRTRLPLPDADQICLALFRSQTAAQGFFVEDGEMWSRTGVLIAQSRQLAVVMGPRKG